MSDRAIPAAEAAISASRGDWATPDGSQAIWIDALCMPRDDPARTECLRSMGMIYRSASQVIVVLSASCSASLRKISNSEQMNQDELLALEGDGWITRGWTYQETANGKQILFVAESDGSVLVPAEDLLNGVLTDGTDIEDTQGIWDSVLSAKYPNLDNLQETIAEHKIVESCGRPAFQVMSAMHSRRAEAEDDRIYSMIGALPNLPLDSIHEPSLSPAEFFMRACEVNNDYSFIFCASPRSDQPGKSWRPIGDKLTPVLSGILAVGSGLSGSWNGESLQLENVCLMRPGAANLDAVSRLSYIKPKDGQKNDLAPAVLRWLRSRSYCGCGEFIELENGYFFAQSSIPSSGSFVVVATQGVQWVGGGPALLVRSVGDGIHEFCDVGIFVGRLPKENNSISL